MQPDYRGLAGYGEQWFRDGGFQSWRTAIGDVSDAGRWIVAEGADPAKLSIVGWGYGGYAALQSGVVAPSLFRSIVAIAPITDLQKLKEDSTKFSNNLVMPQLIGSGPDRKSVVSGKSVSVRVALGGRRILKKKQNKQNEKTINKIK